MEWDILDRDASPFVALEVSAMFARSSMSWCFCASMFSGPSHLSQSASFFVELSMSFMHFEVARTCRRVIKCPPKTEGLVRVLSIADCDDTSCGCHCVVLQ